MSSNFSAYPILNWSAQKIQFCNQPAGAYNRRPIVTTRAPIAIAGSSPNKEPMLKEMPEIDYYIMPPDTANLEFPPFNNFRNPPPFSGLISENGSNCEKVSVSIC